MLDWTLNTNRRLGKESVAKAATPILILLAILPSIALMEPMFSSQLSKFPPFQIPVNLPSTACAQPGEVPGKGMFLVASQQLRDPNFSESVVLLIEYGRQGAMGVIINRPTNVRLSTVLPDVPGLQQRADTLHIGGPVAIGQLLFLIRSDNQPEDSRHIFQDVYVSASLAVLQETIDEGKGRFRVYAGRAGWAPGQLDGELSRGDWHILSADGETIFDKAPSEIWPELIRLISGQWVKRNDPGANTTFTVPCCREPT